MEVRNSCLRVFSAHPFPSMQKSVMDPVAKLIQLARYPVKSMRGEVLPSTTLTLQGLPQDRRYAFVQTEFRSDFPWLTARQLPQLLLYQPVVGAEDPGEPAQSVVTPGGAKWAIDSNELRLELESLSQRRLFLLHDGRGSYDAAPVSLISRQTVALIAEESGTAANPWRFRPNLLVDLQDGDAFDELKWVGRVLRIGEQARVALTEADKRCVMITLDPDTTTSNPNILRSVVQLHEQCAGVYGTVLAPGEIRAGDEIWLED
jgi:uncharacterized protein YcbX